MQYRSILIFFLSCCSFSCGLFRGSSGADGDGDGKLELVIVQVNDVYEIAPLAGGNIGGMARVATIKKEQLHQNPNTLLVMAGDFLSPSVYNSLQFEGKRIRGRQMVDVMNAAGFDIAVFGNHEFDITRNELQERLDESDFTWVNSNCFFNTGDSISYFTRRGEPLPRKWVVDLQDADGTKAKVGFVGVTLSTPTANYVHYEDPNASVEKIYNELKDSCDAVIAITHQTVAADMALAKRIPALPLIVGGHEHDMRFEKVGTVLITKAHSNARSAYLLKIGINKRKKSVKVTPVLRQIDSSVAIDSLTDIAVQRWTNRANDNYQSIGFNPARIVMSSGDSLEGRETFTRRTSTNLTELIVKSMLNACPEADIAIMNSGSIRLDDVLFPPVSEYDFLRTLPFGGPIIEVDMKGTLLKQLLEAGERSRGAGGYLQFGPALPDIQPQKTYRVALTDFLLTGGEMNMGFLNRSNPLVTNVYPEATDTSDARSDIRLAIIRYLTK